MKPHKRLMQSLRDLEANKYRHAWMRPRSSFKTKKGRVVLK